VRRALTALLICGLGTVAVPAAAAPPEDPGPTDAPGTLIAERARGERAIDLLGNDIAVAARRNGKSVRELQQLLRQDRAAAVDTEGHLYYADNFTQVGEPQRAAAAPYPYAQTFSLHSNPGSSRKIYLDFNGHVVSNSRWNADEGISSTAKQPAFNLDGDASTFSEAERDAIQDIWQRVAEDYAPFNVDVTTEDPGAAGLRRSSAGDTAYGIRALITPAANAAEEICFSSCSGVAYLGTFNKVLSSGQRDFQPAWIFAHLSGGTKGIAETTSHEVGHTLGLEHDGDSVSTYYAGHGAWGPIMGSAFLAPIVQWSKGEYAGADNKQADLSVIDNHGLDPRGDDHGNTAGGARALVTTPTSSTGTAKGVISTPGDVDYFSISRPCAGTLTVDAVPAPVSPNLDIRLRVFDSSGGLVTSVNPASAEVDEDVASGLDAHAGPSVAAGTYFLEVDGVGALNPLNTGYSDYGSLGAYTISASSCGVPAVPTSVTAAKNVAGGSVTLNWQPPANDGGYPVTGYVVTKDGVPVATPGSAARNHTFTGLTQGATYTLGVAAVNSQGPGPAVERTVRMVNVAPSAPTELIGYDYPWTGGGDVLLDWEPPSDPGDSPVTGYVVERIGGPTVAPVSLPASETDYWVENLALETPYTFKVSAVSSAGTGEAATYTTTLRVARDPSPPRQVVATPGDRSATVSWMPPLDAGSSPIVQYQVLVYWGDDSTVLKAIPLPVTASTTYPMKYTATGLFNGERYALSVTAINDEGYSEEALSSFVTPRAGAGTVPSAPGIGKAVAGAAGGKITAKAVWTAPTSNGGKAIKGYKVSAYRMSATGTVLGTTVSGLRPATSRSFAMVLPRKGQYRFAVRAVNAIGAGPLSARSNQVAGR
jgi:hypothetical protein